MANWFIIADIDEAEFTIPVGAHEAIKPIRRSVQPHLGKLVLQGNLAACGAKYAAEVGKPHWSKTTAANGA